MDTTTGQPVVPPPEKSFIQKYWMYMAIPLVLMMGTSSRFFQLAHSLLNTS